MTRYQLSYFYELIFFFTLILGLIWCSGWLGQTASYALGGAGFLAMLISWGWREDSAVDLGFCPKLPVGRFVWIGLAGILASAAGVLLIGHWIAPHFWQQPATLKKLSDVSFGYVLGVPFQQTILQGYFTNRLSKIWRRHDFPVALFAGGLFAIVHLPNLVLTAGTLFFGAVTAYYFLKSRNLYIVSFAHIVLSHLTHFLIAAPLVGHGSMRVGPGFWH